MKYSSGDQIIPTFCKIGSSQKLGLPLFNLLKFQHSEKTAPESWRMQWNLMKNQEIASIKLLKLKSRGGDKIIQTFFKSGSPPEIRFPSLICRNSNTQRKVLLNHAETFKNEIQNWVPNNSDFLNSESCRKHWNLANDYEFGSIKLLKLKYRRGDQIIQTFCKSGVPQKLGSPSLIWRPLNILRKLLLNHAECIEI